METDNNSNSNNNANNNNANNNNVSKWQIQLHSDLYIPASIRPRWEVTGTSTTKYFFAPAVNKLTKVLGMGYSGGGLVVSVIAFNCNDLSSNPDDICVKNCSRWTKINEEEVENSPLQMLWVKLNGQ